MTKEEYERLKQAEKAHLHKLKELKQTLFGAQRVASSRQALEEMSTNSQDLLDEHERLVEGLNQDAALSEARMDLALSGEEARSRAEAAEEMEEDLRKARAQEMIRRMREEIASGETREAPRTTPAEAASEQERIPSEKTIGRPAAEPSKQAPEPDEAKSQPEKTIGRMRP